MPDVTAVEIEGLEGFYNGLFLKARSALGVTSFGLAVVEIEAGSDPHPLHDHESEGQEEVYVVLRGSGSMEIEGGGPIALDQNTLVRVGPTTKRKITPGPDGVRLLSIGGIPGKPYEAPGYSEVGAPDPLAS